MRPRVETVRDPLDLAGMPQGSRGTLYHLEKPLELDYRIPGWGQSGFYTSFVLVAGGACGLALGPAFLSLAPALNRFFILSGLLVLGCMLYLAFIIEDQGIRPRALLGFSAVGVALLGVVTSTRHELFAPFGLVAVWTLLFFFSDAITCHYSLWLRANPRLSQPMRNAWLARWGEAFTWLRVTPETRDLVARAKEQDTKEDHERYGQLLPDDALEQELYRGRGKQLLMPLLCAMAFFIASSGGPRGGTGALVCFLGALLALGAVGVPAQAGSLASRGAATWRALASFVNYNGLENLAPGVFQSPGLGRSATHRVLLLGITSAALGLLVAQVALPGFDLAALSRVVDHVLFKLWRSDAAQAKEFLFVVGYGTFLLVLPAALLFGLLAALCARVILYHEKSLAGEGGPLVESGANDTDTEGYLRRLGATSDEREAEHLWLGISAESGHPVLLDRAILGEHAHILGDSGSGKTALGVAPLLSQVARRGTSSVVVIDLKGDMALFEECRQSAEGAGMRFRWFTNQQGSSTYIFNPLLQRHLGEDVSLHQKAEILLQSLGLEHGEAYGRGYYSRQARAVLLRILRAVPEAVSFRELAEMTKGEGLASLGLGKKALEDAGELLAVLESLAHSDPVNATPRTASEGALRGAIDLGDCLEQPEVVYFYLPAAIETAAVREIAKLAVFSLLTAATAYRGKDRVPVTLCIDEFQQVVSENLEIALRQARSSQIGVILANQAMSDLEQPTANLVPVVQANTRLRLYFSSSDTSQQDLLMKASGEAMYNLISETCWTVITGEIKPNGNRRDLQIEDRQSFNISEFIGPRLMRNDIIFTGNDPHLCVAHVTRGSGFTQYLGLPQVLAMDFHISKEEYLARLRAPWPEENEETYVAKEPNELFPTARPVVAPRESRNLGARDRRAAEDKRPPLNKPAK